MTVTYELQTPPKLDQFRALGQFANTYGLQKFRFEVKKNQPAAFRLRRLAAGKGSTVIEHVLREARIPVVRKLEPGN